MLGIISSNYLLEWNLEVSPNGGIWRMGSQRSGPQ
jgi:hypothetical protein